MIWAAIIVGALGSALLLGALAYVLCQLAMVEREMRRDESGHDGAELRAWMDEMGYDE